MESFDFQQLFGNYHKLTMSVAEAQNRKVQKVYIQRDYSEGTAVQFQKKFPLELEGKVSRKTMDQTVQTINKIFNEAERTDAAALLHGCGACLTGYLVYMCMDTPYEKCMKTLAQYIHEQNENVFIPKGLFITNPMERGLRVIEISLIGMNGSN